jgi:C-terminal processing protease CtpA/Prc
LISAATPAFELRHSTYSLAYGRKGTFARITLREPGSSHDVTRLVPHLDRGELVPKLREPRPATGAQLASGVFYVDLHTLDDATWTSVLPKLANASAIVFDLRGYVGPAAFVPLAYLADREIHSPMYLVPVVSPTGSLRYEQSRTYTPPRKSRLRAKAIFLTDARAASAPETILQYVRGERLGIIIGEATGGTNGNIIEYKLIGGMSMRFTGMRVLNHDETVLHGRGVVPDLVAQPTLAGIIAGRDEVLETAVAFAEREYGATRLP